MQYLGNKMMFLERKIADGVKAGVKVGVKAGGERSEPYGPRVERGLMGSAWGALMGCCGRAIQNVAYAYAACRCRR